jgi:hypothetical protein
MNDSIQSQEDQPSRRGRPPRAETITEQSARTSSGTRSPRVPFQSGGKLNVPADLIEKGYRYYWGVDRDGQLDQLQSAWYEFVERDGKRVTANAGKGNVHYLMRIEEQYYKEDMEAQQRTVARLEQQHAEIKQGEYSPAYGRSGEGTALHRERDLI